MPAVSLIVPCRNERDHIAPFLEAVLAQERPAGGFEVLIADGMSDDGTREILARYATDHPEIRMIDNVDRHTPAALNQAIQAARGEVVVRMDVHSTYAPDYVVQCLDVLLRTGADNVGGPWQAVGKGLRQEAIALAFQSPFSSGGAASHALDHEGPVDSVYLGCWRRETLIRLGLFDPELVRNQDDELNLRIVRGGGMVWQSPRIRSWYAPRASFGALFRQYRQYGYWKVRVIQKHRLPASPRHLVPAAFLLTLLALMLLAPFHPLPRVLLLGLLAAYAAADLGISLAIAARHRRLALLPLLAIAFACFHFGYALGFLEGIIDFWGFRKARDSFKALTRGK
jgi:glycosyltransferase involved in cell wall biosynthesis